MKVVIVGGVAGGATTAARLRRLDENAEITIFERSGYVSYANCGLPYFIGGVIEEEEALTLQTPERFWSRFRIDVRTHHEVVDVDTSTKTVTVKNLQDNTSFVEPYDKLVLSPGARPILPPWEGMDSQQVFSLRTVEDTLAIHKFVDERKPQQAVVVGGGFIGLEMAENLTEQGIRVTLVQKLNQIFTPFDGDMAVLLQAQFIAQGVELKLGSSVCGFRQDGNRIITLLEEEQPIEADMVILAIGVSPEAELAKKAGLELGLRGSIAVNNKMETSAPDVYALGDAVAVEHAVLHEQALIALAGPANKQGRIVADNICGGDSRFKGSQASSILKVFDQVAATTGINEEMAKRAGIDYDVVVLSPASHAGYYPGGKTMTMKVLYERGSLRILGAQILGYDGVDKRIDVIATAMAGGMTATSLKDLDLAYAPPFSSAKDLVNMAGFMIENITTGKVKQFHYKDVDRLSHDKKAILLDVRTEEEYAKSHGDGFINIPVDDLRERIGELEKGKAIYLMCQSGVRSYIACRILSQSGFDCYNFSGGYRFYEGIKSGKQAAATAMACGKEVK